MTDIQNIIFETYLQIQKICEKYGLRYWAIGGTCLGAVRHKGFIPWDNDMDIAMPDVDYHKFLEVAPKELANTKYEIRSRLEGHMVTRVFDGETAAIGPSAKPYPDWYIGIQVDIMPFGGMPKGKVARFLHAYTMGLLHFLDSKRVRALSDQPTLKAKIVWCALRMFFLFTSRDHFFDKWNKRLAKYKYDDSEYTGFLWSDQRHAPKLILKTAWFNDWMEMPFETATIRVPKGYDSYLKTQYGDYTTPPSEAEIASFDSDWLFDVNRSYKYYQKHGIPQQ